MNTYPANAPLLVYNIVPISIQIYVVYGQETCIYTILPGPREFAQRPTFRILSARSRRLVRPTPE